MLCKNNMEQTSQSEKLNLQNNNPYPLKIYLFILREKEIKINEEKSAIVLAYDLDSALGKATQVSNGWNIYYHGQSMPVKNLIDALYLEETILPSSQSDSQVDIPKEKLGLEEFKSGLLLVADSYVKDDKDKVEIKRIINSIKE